MSINSPELSRSQKQPEMAWFYGVGYKGKGITYVTTSKQFDALFSDYIEQNGINPYGVWCSCDGGKPDRERGEEDKNLIKEAEKLLLERTGFSATGIQAFHAKLSHDYGNKTEAPFTFQLFDAPSSTF